MTQKGLKNKSFFAEHRYALAFFIFLIGYHVIFVNRFNTWSFVEFTYSHYCVDFSFGFGTKLLPGAIYRFLFNGHTSRLTATIFATALVIIFFILLSFKLEKFMKRMPQKYLNSAFMLVLFFLSGSYTFCIFTKSLGLLDTYWLLIGLAFFTCLEHKYLRFLIPFLVALSLVIHFSAIVFVIPLFCILMLYYVSVTDDKKEKIFLIVIFGLSVILAVIMFVILFFYESRTICSMPEFHRKLNENGSDFTLYYDYAFFHEWKGRVFVPESVSNMKPSFMKFMYLFYYQVKLLFDLLKSSFKSNIYILLCGMIIVLPLVGYFAQFHLSALRQKSNHKLRRFCAFLMIAHFPFIFILAVLFAISDDMTRYLTYAVIPAFCFIFVIVLKEKDMREMFFEKMLSLQNSLPLKLYAFTYFLTTLTPTV